MVGVSVGVDGTGVIIDVGVKEFGVVVGVGVKAFGVIVEVGVVVAVGVKVEVRTIVGSIVSVGLITGLWVNATVDVLVGVGVGEANGTTGVAIFFKHPVTATVTSKIKTVIHCISDFDFIKHPVSCIILPTSVGKVH